MQLFEKLKKKADGKYFVSLDKTGDSIIINEILSDEDLKNILKNDRKEIDEKIEKKEFITLDEVKNDFETFKHILTK